MTRVAIVDDERVIADTLCAILRNSGYKVSAFYDGESALNACSECPPDVLISDVSMPGLDGVELAIQVKSRYPFCRVVLFSGQASTVDILDSARSRGFFFEVLLKPVHPLELLSTLNKTGALPQRERLQSPQQQQTA